MSHDPTETAANPQTVTTTATPSPVTAAATTPSAEPAFRSSDYAPYPKLDPIDVVPAPNHMPPPPISAAAATTMPPESNPYVSPGPVPPSKNKLDTVKGVLGTWGKKAAEATKKGQDIAGNMWQHLRTGPSFTDAAVGRIAQGTKVLAEGGYEKVFRQTFETVPEEKLYKSYACYLSTSAGPVMGILYLSSAKVAFSSDNPLSYKVGEETQWSYYKVLMPLQQLKAVNTSTSEIKPAEKYIQIISVDSHEFWFMGFVNYDNAVKCLKTAMDGDHIRYKL